MTECGQTILSLIDEGLTLTHIFHLNPGWQVNLNDGEHVIIATGDTIEYALTSANDKASCGKYAGTIFHMSSVRAPEESQAKGRSLLTSLGLAKPKEPIKRRI